MDWLEFFRNNWFTILVIFGLSWVFVYLVRKATTLAAFLATVVLVFLLFLARFGWSGGPGSGESGTARGPQAGTGAGRTLGSGTSRPVLLVEVLRVADGNYRLRVDGAGQTEPLMLAPNVPIEQKLEQLLQEKKITPQSMSIQLAVPPGWPSDARRMLEEFFRNRGFEVSVTLTR